MKKKGEERISLHFWRKAVAGGEEGLLPKDRLTNPKVDLGYERGLNHSLDVITALSVAAVFSARDMLA